MNEPGIRKTPNVEDARQARSDGGVISPIAPMGPDRRGIDRLFLDYFGLSEQPFGVTPDLRFLYLGAKHRQALDVLNYGTELDRGFLTLIAKPGMGKTSLLFHYLAGLREKARTVFLFQTDCDMVELMRYVLADLGLDGKGMDLSEMRTMLGKVLMGEMQAGRRFVLVIDEAQNLDDKVLESIRLLSNFETPWSKLMQIVLSGQPQLGDRLANPAMAQLRQRVSFAIRIEPFTREEVNLYIDHRLWVAGYNGSPLFTAGARAALAEMSEGIPRTINNMCFCAMSFVWAMKQRTVDREVMTEVLADLNLGSRDEKQSLALKLPPNPPKLSPKLTDVPKLIVSQAHRPPRHTMMRRRPSRGWFSKFALASVVVFTLGWVGAESNLAKWVTPVIQAVSDTVKSFVTPPSAPVQLSPAPTGGINNPSTSPKQGGISNGKPRSAAPED